MYYARPGPDGIVSGQSCENLMYEGEIETYWTCKHNLDKLAVAKLWNNCGQSQPIMRWIILIWLWILIHLKLVNTQLLWRFSLNPHSSAQPLAPAHFMGGGSGLWSAKYNNGPCCYYQLCKWGCSITIQLWSDEAGAGPGSAQNTWIWWILAQAPTYWEYKH